MKNNTQNDNSRDTGSAAKKSTGLQGSQSMQGDQRQQGGKQSQQGHQDWEGAQGKTQDKRGLDKEFTAEKAQIPQAGQQNQRYGDNASQRQDGKSDQQGQSGQGRQGQPGKGQSEQYDQYGDERTAEQIGTSMGSQGRVGGDSQIKGSTQTQNKHI